MIFPSKWLVTWHQMFCLYHTDYSFLLRKFKYFYLAGKNFLKRTYASACDCVRQSVSKGIHSTLDSAFHSDTRLMRETAPYFCNSTWIITKHNNALLQGVSFLSWREKIHEKILFMNFLKAPFFQFVPAHPIQHSTTSEKHNHLRAVT